MNRRGFLSSILALAAAPAIVRADSLMRIVPRGAYTLAMHRELVAHAEKHDLFRWSDPMLPWGDIPEYDAVYSIRNDGNGLVMTLERRGSAPIFRF